MKEDEEGQRRAAAHHFCQNCCEHQKKGQQQCLFLHRGRKLHRLYNKEHRQAVLLKKNKSITESSPFLSSLPCLINTEPPSANNLPSSSRRTRRSRQTYHPAFRLILVRRGPAALTTTANIANLSAFIVIFLLIGLSIDLPDFNALKLTRTSNNGGEQSRTSIRRGLAGAWRYIYSANVPQGQCLYADFDSSPQMHLSVRGRRPPVWLQQRQRRSLALELNRTLRAPSTGDHQPASTSSSFNNNNNNPQPVAVEWAAVPPSPSYHTRGSRQKRIVNGEPVDVAQWPFLVAILTPDGPITSQGRKWDENCGGVLVHREFILTAAHCVIHTTESSAVMRNPNDLLVRIGDFNLYTSDRTFEDIVVDKTFQHPRYNPFQIDHGFDVALLHLTRPVSQSAVVPLRTACLPPPGLVLPNDAVCMVAGWGATQTDGNTSAIPLFTRLKLVPYSRCRDLFDMASEVGDGRVFCAGPPGPGPADTCQGDSGSPIFCHVPAGGPVNGAVAWTSIWQLYGVVSFGGDLCGPVDLSPSVYTSVVYFRQWLTDTIANEMAQRSSSSNEQNNNSRRTQHQHRYQGRT